MNRYSQLLRAGAAMLLFAVASLFAQTDTVSHSESTPVAQPSLMSGTDTVSRSDSTSAAHSPEFSLDAVTVTGPKRRDLDPEGITNPYKVEKTASVGTQIITPEDIKELAPKDVFDLLNKAVGLNVTYQGRKSPFFIETRGGGSLTYILDGAVLPTSSNRILQKIPMSAIEEIQIVRGSTSLALGPSIPIGSSNSGSGVVTGSVIIRTRQPKGKEASMSGFVEKSDDHPLVPVTHGQSLFVGAHMGNKSTKGFFSGINGYVGGLAAGYDYPSIEDRFDGTTSDAKMVTTGLNFKMFSIDAMFYRDRGRLEMQRGVKVTGQLDSAKWYYDPLITTVMSSNMNLAWTENQATLFSWFSTKYDQTEFNEKFGVSAPVTSKNFIERTKGFSLRHNARFVTGIGTTLIQPGYQFNNSEGFGPNTSNSYNKWKTSVSGLSAMAEQDLFNKQVTLNAGYRRDVKHIDYSATDIKKINANNDVDLAPANIFTCGAQWLIKDKFLVNASYFNGSEGKAGDFDIKTKTGAALSPNKQQRIEAAFKIDWKKYLCPTLTVFDIDVKNQKSATTDTFIADGNSYYYYTESDANRQGIELLLQGDIISGTKYSASWTHMMKNVTIASDGKVTDALGLSSPDNLFTLTISQAVRDYFVTNISVKRVDPWTSSTSAMGTAYDVHLGDYVSFDANILKDFVLDGHTITAKLYGRNLANQKYATRYTTGYYYARGVTVGLSLDVNLGL